MTEIADAAVTYHVLDIIRGTTVDGPGFRTSIYLAGCGHHCPGCHNPQSWPDDAGTPMSLADIMSIVCEEDFDVTLTGGDPLYRPEETLILAKAVRATGHTVWLYTGYVWEHIIANPRMRKVLDYIDVVVEGPYVEALRDTDLLFRGSSNQRIIHVAEALTSTAGRSGCPLV